MEQSRSDRDHEIIGRQELAMVSGEPRESTLRAILDRHSRARHREDTTISRRVVDFRPDPDAVLVVADEVLVRSRDAGRAAQVLSDAGITHDEPEPVDCGRAEFTLPISRLRVPPNQLETAVLTLHTEKIEASFNHALPSGPVVKGGGSGPGKPTGAGLSTAADPSAGKGVVVAIIDTGIAANASQLHPVVLSGVGATAENIDPLDTLAPAGLDYGAGHGTFVAGVVRQVAPAADVRLYRALDSDGIGSEVDVACAMLRAALEDGANVINLSLGQQSFGDRPPIALTAAIEMLPPEVIVVAAAGNDGSSRPCWPAAFRRVVAVGARANSGDRATYSNWGSWVDASTLGSGIISTFVQGKEVLDTSGHNDDWSDDDAPLAIWSGTSFAAPQIAGLIAAGVATHGSPRAALNAILSTGSPEPDMGMTITSPLTG